MDSVSKKEETSRKRKYHENMENEETLNIVQLAAKRYEKYLKKRKKKRNPRFGEADFERMQNIGRFAQEKCIAARIQRQASNKAARAFDKVRDIYLQEKSREEVQTIEPEVTEPERAKNQEVSSSISASPAVVMTSELIDSKEQQSNERKRTKLSFRLKDIDMGLACFATKLSDVSARQPSVGISKKKTSPQPPVGSSTN